jgi:G:T-mismatch repair DNA endonuclease (very short patch repair protein)
MCPALSTVFFWVFSTLMFGKKHTAEALEKIAGAPHLSNPDYRSKPERELEQQCRNLGSLENNVRIGKWNVDVLFTEKRMIVELFGDYWHMNPVKYASTVRHSLMGKTADEVWSRDERKLKDLRDQGYEVVVVWESDWRHDPDACVKRIRDAYDRTL